MKKIKLPKIKFSRWHHCDDRKNIPGVKNKGIYIVAKLKRKPSGRARAITEHIIYIGETCSHRGIEGRVSKFISGKGHSAGRRHAKDIKANRKNIFIAGYAPRLVKEDCLKAYIRYVERKLIWNYAAKYGKMPRFNRK